MILSEKASAFFIENLISNKDINKKPSSNSNNNKTKFKLESNDNAYFSCSSSTSSFSSQHNSPYASKCNASPIHDCVSPVSSDEDIKKPAIKNKHSFKYHCSNKFVKTDHETDKIGSISSISSANFSASHSPMSATISPHISPNASTDSFQRSHKRKNSIEKLELDLDNQSKYKKDKPDDYEQFMTKAKTESCIGDLDLNDIECFLETDDLWKKFHELGTEMIITKSGRRMFPPLRVSFGGARLNQKYIIAMDIVPTDSKRYRYAYHRSSWLVAGKADPPVQSRLFIHPDGPFTGEALYKQIVSFEKVKLTNNEMDKCGHVI